MKDEKMPMIKCDPRARARCPFKNHCCGDEVAYFLDGSDCDKFNQSVLAPPPTNADRIRAMSDEELANLLTDFSNNAGWVTEIGRQICYEQYQKWLQQPEEEGK